MRMPVEGRLVFVCFFFTLRKHKPFLFVSSQLHIVSLPVDSLQQSHTVVVAVVVAQHKIF